MTKAYLGLGSNIGDKREYIDKAIELVGQNKEIEVLKTSSYYETEPVGYKEQEWFLNVVIEIKTDLKPYDLLEYCMETEQKLKRVRKIRWGPRTIDIDILLYGDLNLDDDKLTIPHPRMIERAFVLVPLLEIAPNISINNMSLEDKLKALSSAEIRKVNL